MRDGGDQIRTRPLEPGPLLRAAQRDGEPADRCALARPVGPRGRVPRAAHVADGDEHLGAVAQVERALRVPGPDRQPVVRAGLPPPAAPLVVAERQRRDQLTADGLVGADPGQPLRSTVEDDDPAALIGDDQPVGKLVSAQQVGVAQHGSARLGRRGGRPPGPPGAPVPLRGHRAQSSIHLARRSILDCCPPLCRCPGTPMLPARGPGANPRSAGAATRPAPVTHPGAGHDAT